MKAAVLEDVGRMVIKEVPDPECPPGGILIEVGACAVCGTDVKVYRHGHRLIVPPRITGHELAGTVLRVGEGLEEFSPGDRVAVAPVVPCGKCYYCRRGIQTMCDELTAIGYHYDGGFAPLMAVPERAVRNGCVNKLPDTLSIEESALAEPLACCINAQDLCEVGPGQTVAIIGAGPIGALNAQLARCRGASKVILIDISEERLTMVRFLEPDLSIVSSKQDPIEPVMEATEGRGADVVIVACSSGPAQEQSLELVAKRGVVDFFGGLPKDKPFINFNSNLIHYREFKVVGNHGSAPHHNELAIKLLASGQIDASPLITHRFPVERTIEAIETTERAEGLKVIVIASSQSDCRTER